MGLLQGPLLGPVPEDVLLLLLGDRAPGACRWTSRPSSASCLPCNLGWSLPTIPLFPSEKLRRTTKNKENNSFPTSCSINPQKMPEPSPVLPWAGPGLGLPPTLPPGPSKSCLPRKGWSWPLSSQPSLECRPAGAGQLGIHAGSGPVQAAKLALDPVD